MPKIKQLSPHEAQKIAAGEVVERPANIVKELIENSIDAGATRITIYIEDSGKQLIRVVDDGCGMDITDAQTCFNRHATSKITYVDELDSLNTFGFRGEALASIAAVSQITLITKEEQYLEGTQVLIEANNIIKINAIACATGTDLRIQNLFFNVPARKKFLKSSQTEWRAIQLLFNAFCLDYPYIHFSLSSEGKQVLNCPVADSIKQRASQLWEHSLHNHLIEISTNDDEKILLHGVISDHQQYRYDRSSIYFFVNKRWVKNHHLSSALIKAYANVIPNGRYPIAAICITVPSNEIDINIHPRKEEIKFLHPKRVEQALQQTVKAALENIISNHLKKNISLKQTSIYQKSYHQFNPFTVKPSDFNAAFIQPYDNQVVQTNHIIQANKAIHDTASQEPTHSQENAQIFQISLPEVNEIIPQNENDSYRLIGQYNKTYLLIEKEQGLFLVDQHAAHERILYELFSQRFNEVATIQLMFPSTITLSTHDIALISPHLDIFTSNGIVMEQCARDQLIVQSLPVHLKNQSLDDLVNEAVSWIIEGTSLDESSLKKTINDKLQAQMACKAAVKAGDILTEEQMNQLLNDLTKTTNRFSCPHGRPTGWLLALNEIEKKFKRRL